MKNKFSSLLKATYIAVLSSVALGSAYLGYDVGRVSDPFVSEMKNANGTGTNYWNDFDISGDSNCSSIPSFAGKENERFGTVINAGTAYGEDERITYKSNWAPWQAPTTEVYTKRIFKTYRFGRYVSLPVKEEDSLYLNPNTSMTYTITHTTGSSETVTDMIERSYSVTESMSETIGLEIGAKVPLGDIQAGGKMSSETTIAVSTTLNTTVRREESKTVTYTEQQSSTWPLANSTNQRRFFKFHYRKKFKVYFTAQYLLNYSCTRTGVNAFGYDDQYTYTFIDYTPEKTSFFLIPVDSSMYFGYDEYYNNAQGDEQIVTPLQDNVVYL